MEPRVFHVNYDKFKYVYVLYPPLLGFFFYGGLSVVEWLLMTAAFTGGAIYVSRRMFDNLVYKRTAITVTETALETEDLSGKVLSIPFRELLGPFEDKCGPVKRFKYMSSGDAKKRIVVTNLTESFDELVTLIAQKVKDAG